MNKQKYPKYYKVQDTVVRLDYNKDNNTVSGYIVVTGDPYAPAKAIVDGYEITKDEADKLTAPYIKPLEP